jgi:hypothetical protein
MMLSQQFSVGPETDGYGIRILASPSDRSSVLLVQRDIIIIIIIIIII